MFDTLEADIVVMQETKIQRKDLRDDMVLVPGWDVYFSLPRFKKGRQSHRSHTLHASMLINMTQDILALLSTRETQSAAQSVPRKESLVSSAQRTQPPSFVTSLRINRSVDIRS